MNINATIILQAINFWIAYLIFRFILLKPAYAAIVADNQKREQLEFLIADDKKRIERQQEEIAGQWRASYIFFKQQMPAPTELIMVQHVPLLLLPAPTLDIQQVIEMRRDLSDAIVAAIGAQHESR